MTTKPFWIWPAALLVLLVIGCSQLTFFVVQPIGMLPDGMTVVMLRRGRLQFIDSADAICAREMGGVSLLCRGMALGAVQKNAIILLRLPYSETLYRLSTGGDEYRPGGDITGE